MSIEWAQWPVAKNIVAGVSIRSGGISQSPYDSNNMGDHVGDDIDSVAQNRSKLITELQSSTDTALQWQWLNQVHGTDVIDAGSHSSDAAPTADACYSNQAGQVCSVMTADCLPILLCAPKHAQNAGEVAAIHAGWRSLCHGVIENTVARFDASATELSAWLGPAIGPQRFEVGEDVLEAFKQQNCGDLAEQAFTAKADGKYLADLYQLARIRLQALGITNIYGGGECTYQSQDKYYSYRRDGVCGRMVSFIYMK